VPAWSILIATLASRQEKLQRLLGVLLPQAEKAGNVEVVALHNLGEYHIGRYRQALLEDARGEYVSFFDDDDLPEPDFVESVLTAMRERPEGKPPDYIAFYHVYYEDGIRWPLSVITGLEYRDKGWVDTAEGYYRDVTHVNPARAELARQASFIVTAPGQSEDRLYNDTIRRLARTQAVIPRELYHYYHSRSDSVQFVLPPQPRLPPLTVASPAFRWHEGSTW